MNDEYAMMGMPGLGFFGLLAIGFLAGYIAKRAMNRETGLFTNILVGIAGSFVGGTLADLLDIRYQGFLGNLIVATVGAIVVLWIFTYSADRRDDYPR